MEKLISDLTYEWFDAAEHVVGTEPATAEKIQKLFRETQKVLEAYNEQEIVPKSITFLMLKMKEFAEYTMWFSSSPLHHVYQEVVSIVSELEEGFLTSYFETEKIEEFINALSEPEN